MGGNDKKYFGIFGKDWSRLWIPWGSFRRAFCESACEGPPLPCPLRCDPVEEREKKNEKACVRGLTPSPAPWDGEGQQESDAVCALNRLHAPHGPLLKLKPCVNDTTTSTLT